MNDIEKIVLHSIHGYRPELDALVSDWISQGVKYVGVIGLDADQIEDVIDWLCIGDGSAPYFMVTASHRPEESIHDAMSLAEQMPSEFGTSVRVIEL